MLILPFFIESGIIVTFHFVIPSLLKISFYIQKEFLSAFDSPEVYLYWKGGINPYSLSINFVFSS